jgi:hypothetical protein
MTRDKISCITTSQPRPRLPAEVVRKDLLKKFFDTQR